VTVPSYLVTSAKIAGELHMQISRLRIFKNIYGKNQRQ
jgi:hypothetical protein